MKRNSFYGFSLVEVMIAIALLGGISLVVIQIITMTSKNTTQFNMDTDVGLITNEIVAILSKPSNCMATVGGKNASNTPAGIVNSISLNGVAMYNVGGLYGNAKVKVLSYSLSDSDSDVGVTINATKLTVNYARKKMQIGSGDIVKKVKLYVEVDASGNITNCRSLSSESDIWSRGSGTDIYYNGNVGVDTTIPRAKLDVRGAIRVADDSSACTTANEGSQRYNSGTKRMEFCNGSSWGSLLNVASCPSGKALVGINAGNPVCENMPSGGGIFQTYICGGGCRIPNFKTGFCSCPVGFTAFVINEFSAPKHPPALCPQAYYEDKGMIQYVCN